MDMLRVCAEKSDFLLLSMIAYVLVIRLIRYHTELNFIVIRQ